MTVTDTCTNFRSETPAYILAGGHSRRFGSDKARATLRGRPLILTLSDQLIGLGFKVTVVGKHDDQYTDLGLDTIGDIEPDQGPIGGLHTALTHRGEGWLLLCSCDMLDIDEHWIAALFDRAHRSPDADVIAARDERWQPFPALYHARLRAAPALREAGSFQRLLERVRTERIDAGALPAVRQINTAEELRRFDAPDAGPRDPGSEREASSCATTAPPPLRSDRRK